MMERAWPQPWSSTPGTSGFWTDFNHRRIFGRDCGENDRSTGHRYDRPSFLLRQPESAIHVRETPASSRCTLTQDPPSNRPRETCSGPPKCGKEPEGDEATTT